MNSPYVTASQLYIDMIEAGRKRIDLNDYFTDPDGDALTITMQDGPDFAYVNYLGKLIIDPEETSQNGSYSFTVVASDGRFTSAPLTVELDVVDYAVWEYGSDNSAPDVLKSPETVSLGEGGSKQLTLADYFRDADNDPLSWTLQGAPAFATISNGKLSFNPKDGDDGSYSFTVVASDGTSQSDPMVVDLSVADTISGTTDPGAPLALSTSFSIEVVESGRKRIDLNDYFTDPDGDALTITMQDGPDFAYVNYLGKLIIDPEGAGDNGAYSFVVTASDGRFTSSPMTINLGVSEDYWDTDPDSVSETGNSAPDVLKSPETVSLGEGGSKQLTLADYFRDVDNDPLSWTLQGAPAFATINNGKLSFNPKDGDDGSYSFTVKASDGTTQSDPMVVDLSVADTITEVADPGAPIALSASFSIDMFESDRKRIDLNDYFTDPDGDALTITMQGGPDFVYVNYLGKLIVDPEGAGDNGFYSFSVSASDGPHTSSPVTINLAVGEDYWDGGSGSDGGGSDPVPDPDSGSGSGDSTGYTPTKHSLTASKDVWTEGLLGTQEWGDGVTLTGYDLKGNLAKIGYFESPNERGFGVDGPGSRWKSQIDYSETDGGRSEKFVIDFNGNVTDVMLDISMMGVQEHYSWDETGKWTAYAENGSKVGTGLIGPELSALGAYNKVSGSYGTFPIEVDLDVAFERLVIEATQFSHGEGRSGSKNYGENNSDIAVEAVDYVRVEPVDDFLF